MASNYVPIGVTCDCACFKPMKSRHTCTWHFREQVDAFYHAALNAGGIDNGAPGLRPNYHAHYYAAFVIAPDGHNIEAVCHNPMS